VKQFYTYLHSKPNGDPFYVGKGHTSRCFELNHKRSQWYKKIISKYGKENIEVLVFHADSEDQSFLAERILIRFFGRQDIGTGCLVNQTDGGEGACGLILSVEAKKKLSESHTGMKHTDEAREKMSVSKKGNKNALGYKHTSDEKLKMSAAWSRRLPASHDTRAKLSTALKGKPWSSARRRVGNKKRIGSKHTPESRAKMSASWKGIPWSPARRAAFEARKAG
jgi:hypothetical protein